MGVRKETEKEYGRLLFVSHGLNQKEAAAKVKVTEKTFGRWIVEGKWHEQKNSLLSTRNTIIDKLTNQIRLLNEKFDSRDDKLATLQEGRLLVDYARSIKSLETEIGVGEIITTSKGLITFVQKIDFDFSKKLTDYADLYINSKIK
jgi:predicted DNA-binding protein (UPF0251 family)